MFPKIGLGVLVQETSHVQCLAVETFGRFRLVKRIGEGGMGEIFFARSASIDGFEKNLVIKRIRRELTKNKKFTSMFINEARVAINLTHANVVQVFDFGEAEGCYYLAMEYVDGCDTADLLDIPSGAKGLPSGIALYIMAEALKGLDYAHNLVGNSGDPLNIVHRDISPDNIMVSYNGEVKVTDFGVAKAKGLAKLEEDGTVVGKYPYMSPEHAPGQVIDRRAVAAVAKTAACRRGPGECSARTRTRCKALPAVRRARRCRWTRRRRRRR